MESDSESEEETGETATYTATSTEETESPATTQSSESSAETSPEVRALRSVNRSGRSAENGAVQRRQPPQPRRLNLDLDVDSQPSTTGFVIKKIRSACQY